MLRSERVKQAVLEELTRQRSSIDGDSWPESVSIIVRLDRDDGRPYKVQFRTESIRSLTGPS
jgi:hypothetical protein